MDLSELTVEIFGSYSQALYQRTKKHIIKAKVIPSFMMGNRYYVKTKDVETWLNSTPRGTSE